MQIKRSTIYAIQALREYQGSKDILSTTDIAKRLDISIAYANKVNRTLIQGGFIESIRGSQGGYKLARDLSKTPIAELVRQIDGGLLEEEGGETRDMLAIRKRLRETLGGKGWGEPISGLL
jgi:Rrf2 family protein